MRTLWGSTPLAPCPVVAPAICYALPHQGL